VEQGAASQIVGIANQAGVPLADTQKELTPFQRLVIVKELERQHEESQSNQRGGGRPGPIKNSKASSRGGGGMGSMQGETIKYVNESTEDK
jgi:hypothetical protein